MRLAVALLVVVVVASSASAQTDTTPPAERPQLFVVDPSLPAAGHVLVTAGMGNVARSGEERPAGAGQLIPTAGVEVGVSARVALFADGSVALPAQSAVEARAGVHVLLTRPTSPVRVAVRASVGRDFQSTIDSAIEGVVAWDVRAVRLALSMTASHTFRAGTDTVDVGGAFAATVRLPAGFRVGGEAVAVDLEEVGDPQAEGGATALAGPTLGWEGHRVQIVGGPAFGLAPGVHAAALFARVAATLSF